MVEVAVSRLKDAFHQRALHEPPIKSTIKKMLRTMEPKRPTNGAEVKNRHTICAEVKGTCFARGRLMSPLMASSSLVDLSA